MVGSSPRPSLAAFCLLKRCVISLYYHYSLYYFKFNNKNVVKTIILFVQFFLLFFFFAAASQLGAGCATLCSLTIFFMCECVCVRACLRACVPAYVLAPSLDGGSKAPGPAAPQS